MPHRKNKSARAKHILNARQIVTISRLLNKLLDSTSNMLISLEDIRLLFPRLRLDIVSDDELPDEEARAYPKRWRIKIRKGMKEGLLRGDSRARWSLAHELAHVFLQHPKPFLARPRKGDLQTQHELQANLFAATFLAPYEKASQYKTSAALRDAFQISSGAAISRLGELKRDERLRRLAKERGLPEERFSIEAGSCNELEKQSTIASIAIASTRRDYSSRSIPVEPLNSSLLGASLLVAAGSNLLLEAYRRAKQIRPASNHEAAALAVTILVLQPLRMERGLTANFEIVSESNEQCARRAIAALLKMEMSALDDVELPKQSQVSQYAFEPSYLYSLSIAAPTLVSDSNLISTIDSLPQGDIYSRTNELRPSEAESIETLARKLATLPRTAN